jgi:hypothetical protein
MTSPILRTQFPAKAKEEPAYYPQGLDLGEKPWFPPAKTSLFVNYAE